MAERKAVNKYYPPDWDPSKGSINTYVGQHPLRDRAKKLGQGILVIRFEMPYNIWCGGCGAHIGMGVRYNAEKTKTGNYYSTPIYKFRMKCHLCDNYFEIQTDPKNHDYVILEGARRKEQRWDPKENEQIVPEDKNTQKKLATDAMFKLEHGSDDKLRGKKAVSNLSLLELSKEGMKDDYILNKIARNKFRDEKKALKKIKEDDEALLKKSSLDINLLDEKEEDKKLAELIRLRAVESYDEKQALKRKEIESRPLFLSKTSITDNETNDLPQAKKLKVIRDNLRKAKVKSATSPFDRTKTNTLGIGLTKDQLGIRKKSTINSSKTDNSDQCTDQEKATLSVIHDSDIQGSRHYKNHQINDLESDETNFIVSPDENMIQVNTENGDNETDTCAQKDESSGQTDRDSGNKAVSKQETDLRDKNKSHSTNGHSNLVEHSDKSTAQLLTKPSLSLVSAYSDSEDTD